METKHIARRDFFKTAGISSLAVMGAGMIKPETAGAIDMAEPMKITKIEAVRKRGMSMWVRIYTDKGIVGLGETYGRNESSIGSLRDFSRQLLNRDPRDIERIWRDMYGTASFTVTGGAEMRIISAVNMALWDILGKALEVPVYRLLGGKAQQKVRVYSTCTAMPSAHKDWTMEKDTEKITEFFLDQGVKALKIYPYENFGSGWNPGTYISPVQLEKGLDWIKRIRKTAGKEMDIGIDTMCAWNLPCAVKIAHSLEPYDIMFIEDMLLPDNAQSYTVLARETTIPLLQSERSATRYGYREMLEAKAVDIAMLDVAWCGGLSEAKKISDLADTYYIPTSIHTCCSGPINWNASIHAATTMTNFFIMESNWYYVHDEWPNFANDVPKIVNGYVTVPETPGLGVELREDIFRDGTATIVPIAEV
ncbi:mandelate racemase/muconate lactonizing enzyme family protein [Candidatus Latescibacterota bacterium]